MENDELAKWIKSGEVESDAKRIAFATSCDERVARALAAERLAAPLGWPGYKVAMLAGLSPCGSREATDQAYYRLKASEEYKEARRALALDCIQTSEVEVADALISRSLRGERPSDEMLMKVGQTLGLLRADGIEVRHVVSGHIDATIKVLSQSVSAIVGVELGDLLGRFLGPASVESQEQRAVTEPVDERPAAEQLASSSPADLPSAILALLAPPPAAAVPAVPGRLAPLPRRKRKDTGTKRGPNAKGRAAAAKAAAGTKRKG